MQPHNSREVVAVRHLYPRGRHKANLDALRALNLLGRCIPAMQMSCEPETTSFGLGGGGDHRGQLALVTLRTSSAGRKLPHLLPPRGASPWRRPKERRAPAVRSRASSSTGGCGVVRGFVSPDRVAWGHVHLTDEPSSGALMSRGGHESIRGSLPCSVMTKTTARTSAWGQRRIFSAQLGSDGLRCPWHPTFVNGQRQLRFHQCRLRAPASMIALLRGSFAVSRTRVGTA